jgi:diguanylate cyclase (GGDEF)-like protein/putative nucleotidyltransferase with HDIG domain
MVDVDHFKRVNDQHGHAVGDKVLQNVGRILKSLARDTDVVCRYGGEEFCILLAHTNLEGATQGAERFRQAIESQPSAGICITASLGVSALGTGASSARDLLSQADEALYRAKRGGRNRVHLWSSEDAPAQPQATGTSAEPPRDATTPAPTIPFGAVTALMSVLAHRDKATAAHSHRVADLCVATASGLLGAGDCFVLEVAALLHDIGKLGVPDSILLKPGPLTEEEWSIMRKHDRMGAEIVQSAFANEELTRIVRSHHAWYGGTPKNPEVVNGVEIPLAARILSVCDAYDAMISDRPYREGRTTDEAFAELRSFAGTQFDAEVVTRVIEVVSRRASGLTSKSTTPVEVQTIAGIQRELDRLAHALDSRDLSLLAAMAGRLSASAHREGLPEIARLAKDLEHSASVLPESASHWSKWGRAGKFLR